MILDDFDSLWFYSNILFSHPPPPPPPPSSPVSSPSPLPPPPSSPLSTPSPPPYHHHHQPHFSYSPKEKPHTPKSTFVENKVETYGRKKDWVFSKVFSSPHPPPPLSLSSTSQQFCCQLHTPKQKLDTPKSPFLQTKQVEVMVVEPYEKERLVKTPESMKKDKKSPKSSSKRRDKEIMKLNELVEFKEFGFISFQDDDNDNDDDEISPMSSEFFYPYFSCKMPPFNEGMIIKEYLKSWACAVASTVR